jgi:hypothetical protein
VAVPGVDGAAVPAFFRNTSAKDTPPAGGQRVGSKVGTQDKRYTVSHMQLCTCLGCTFIHAFTRKTE